MTEVSPPANNPQKSAAQEEWWDRSLTSAGRSDILKAARLKLPARVAWRHMSPEARAAVDHMRPSRFRPEDHIQPNDTDATADKVLESPAQATIDSLPTRPSPASVLQSIQDRLAQDDVLPIIEQSMPRTLTDAITWARCLPFWEEFKGQFPDQAIAVARVLSRRAMKEFGLAFDDQGRVVEKKHIKRAAHVGKPTSTFPLQIAEETVQVEYTEQYFPNSSTDSFSFIGQPIEPPPDGIFKHKPHPLSETGYWHSYASHDAVEAVGGAQKYAQLLGAAKLQDREHEFQAILEGESPEIETRRKKPIIYTDHPVIGEHTAAVVEERQDPEKPVKQPEKHHQGELFA